MDYAADSALFLADSPHTATVTVVVTPADEENPAVTEDHTVPVNYDAPYKAEGVYEGEVATTAPACTMLDSDVAALAVQYGTAVTIKKGAATVGTFTVTAPEPDGMGLTRLILQNTEE